MNPLPELEAALEDDLRSLVARFNPIILSSSLGAEDMVLFDQVSRLGLSIEVFTLDTGRLPEATYRLLERLREAYELPVRVVCPDNGALERLYTSQGANGFYRDIDARRACCAVRKVQPLRRALQGYQAWVTGLRRDQALTRTALKAEAWDADHGLVKANPLVAWTREDVWQYLDHHRVPYNSLHDAGYASIGCSPCTRAIEAGEDERAGRWWWENPTTRECGLHVTSPIDQGELYR